MRCCVPLRQMPPAPSSPEWQAKREARRQVLAGVRARRRKRTQSRRIPQGTGKG